MDVIGTMFFTGSAQKKWFSVAKALFLIHFGCFKQAACSTLTQISPLEQLLYKNSACCTRMYMYMLYGLHGGKPANAHGLAVRLTVLDQISRFLFIYRDSPYLNTLSVLILVGIKFGRFGGFCKICQIKYPPKSQKLTIRR